MSRLATIWFWIVFLVTAPLCLAIGTVIYLLSLAFDHDRRVLHWFVTGWTLQYLRAWPGWSIRVTGQEHLPPQPCVMVANHQSMADVVAAMGIRYQYKFVSKASLFSLPIVGWLMRMMRYVGLERGRHGSTKQMMERSRFWLRRKMSVLIFPEGTYAEGGAMLPFRRGAFTLAMEEQVPIVPVLIRGTDQLIAGDGPWMSARAKMQVEVLPPVPPETFGEDAQALAERVREQMAKALGREQAS